MSLRGVRTCHRACMEDRGQWVGPPVNTPHHHVSLRDFTQAFHLDSKCLFPLGHLTGPFARFMLKNYAIKLFLKLSQKSHNVSVEFAILCWATFIAIFDHVCHTGKGWTCLAPKKRTEFITFFSFAFAILRICLCAWACIAEWLLLSGLLIFSLSFKVSLNRDFISHL